MLYTYRSLLDASVSDNLVTAILPTAKSVVQIPDQAEFF